MTLYSKKPESTGKPAKPKENNKTDTAAGCLAAPGCSLTQNLLYRLPPLAYCVLIFIQSSFPVSGAVPEFPLSDKLMHLGGYALLGILTARALVRENLGLNLTGTRNLAIGLGALYGAFDEFHQSFVAGRQATLGDFAADIAGCTVGVIIYLKFFQNKKRL